MSECQKCKDGGIINAPGDARGILFCECKSGRKMLQEGFDNMLEERNKLQAENEGLRKEDDNLRSVVKECIEAIKSGSVGTAGDTKIYTQQFGETFVRMLRDALEGDNIK